MYESSCLYALAADAPTISQTYGTVEVYQLLAESRRMAQAKYTTRWQSQKQNIRTTYTEDVCDEAVYERGIQRTYATRSQSGQIKRMTNGLQKQKYTKDVYKGRMRRDLRRDLVLGLRSRATRRGGPKVTGLITRRGIRARGCRHSGCPLPGSRGRQVPEL